MFTLTQSAILINSYVAR